MLCHSPSTQLEYVGAWKARPLVDLSVGEECALGMYRRKFKFCFLRGCSLCLPVHLPFSFFGGHFDSGRAPTPKQGPPSFPSKFCDVCVWHLWPVHDDVCSKCGRSFTHSRFRAAFRTTSIRRAELFRAASFRKASFRSSRGERSVCPLRRPEPRALSVSLHNVRPSR